MKIIVAGPGCARCVGTEKVVADVVAEMGIDADVAHLFDVREYAKLGVRLTPAVIVDGEIALSGRVPTMDEVRKALGG